MIHVRHYDFTVCVPTLTPHEVETLRAKYRAERDRRLRPDGGGRYRPTTGEFGYYAGDPYTERVEREQVTDLVDATVVGGAPSELTGEQRELADFVRARRHPAGGGRVPYPPRLCLSWFPNLFQLGPAHNANVVNFVHIGAMVAAARERGARRIEGDPLLLRPRPIAFHELLRTRRTDGSMEQMLWND
ncbi:hypothetical protein Aph02nite_83070 [Actinoplanes philippinensis]|uniref:Uncharacterized protein n=1 Tax=Actinoplanes philippinensis TaxID=35752 RepID=A0A1I2L8M0_9ACTN|nr:hypothetical protein [Actinoplanes philippinensis]GIE82357.1 hypothetical protein Aph02nite_83070 [Actinoplanes philippinensis]SFF75565.1 hypothetical protein SAMN05421541_120135 [Actinoplanes philippinensis]